MKKVLDEIKKELFQEITTGKVSDDMRDIPLYRDIFHIIGSVRCAALLAKKRGIDCDIAEITMSLHDISRLRDGKIKDHAINSAIDAEEVLIKVNVDESIRNQIVASIKSHVNKSEVNHEFDELIKDADLLDAYLNGDEFKNIELNNRIDKIKKELNI